MLETSKSQDEKKKHVAIEDPGAINKLFKRNFAAAVRVHDPAAIAAPCGDMVDPCGSGSIYLEDSVIICDYLYTISRGILLFFVALRLGLPLQIITNPSSLDLQMHLRFVLRFNLVLKLDFATYDFACKTQLWPCLPAGFRL